MRPELIFLCVLLLCACAVPAWTVDPVPFVLPWDDSTPSSTDLSSWLGKPAGAKGFVRAGDNGHLYVGDERIRFLGVNLCFGANFPTHDESEKIAGRMAKFGINCVRFHHMDSRRFPDGILLRDGGDTSELDPEALDRLDYLIAQLKRHGIYVDLNLLVSRPFRSSDGLPAEIDGVDWKDTHVVGFFHEPALELQKDYARALLTHRNLYTGVPYADEPAVAFVEINNENGLLHAWLGGRIDRLPSSFQDDLRELWNRWLQDRYDSTDELRRAWGEGSRPLDQEMLRNPSLRNDADQWNLERHGGAQANVTSDNDSVRIEVIQTGSAGWHVQLNQRSLVIESGEPYTVSFRAKADAPRRLGVGVGMAHDPWGSLGFGADARLTSEWLEFHYTFTASASDDNARLNLSNLGESVGVTWIADVSLKPGGIVGVLDGDTLEDGSVAAFPRDAIGGRSLNAQRDWLRFLRDTEDDYWQGMYRHIKQELGVQALVFGTIVACSTPNLQAALDVIDTHAYWQHPVFPGRPWDSADWTVGNVSAVNTPGGALADLALQRVVGKPTLCTEFNHSAPNTYGSEAPILLAAYAALQDWDGVFLFAYCHRRSNWDMQRVPNFFDIDQHPLKMANLLLAASMFVRGDVSAARQWVTAALSPEQEIETIRTKGRGWSVANAGHLGVPTWASLVHRIGLRVGDAPAALASVEPGARPTSEYRSDTGELTWNVERDGKGFVSVNTPRTRAFVGFVDGRTFELGDVTIQPGETSQDWCTVGVTLLEGDSFAGPCRALIVATGFVENTDMGWKDAARTTVGRDWGNPPSRVEVVPLRLILPVASARVEAWALNELGERRGRLTVRDVGGKSVVEVTPEAGTVWYEVTVR